MIPNILHTVDIIEIQDNNIFINEVLFKSELYAFIIIVRYQFLWSFLVNLNHKIKCSRCTNFLHIYIYNCMQALAKPQIKYPFYYNVAHAIHEK